MFNNLEEILRSIAHTLFFLSVPVNIIYYALVKIDDKLARKLGGKDE